LQDQHAAVDGETDEADEHHADQQLVGEQQALSAEDEEAKSFQPAQPLGDDDERPCQSCRVAQGDGEAWGDA
jgi:hypothetical protein